MKAPFVRTLWLSLIVLFCLCCEEEKDLPTFPPDRGYRISDKLLSPSTASIYAIPEVNFRTPIGEVIILDGKEIRPVFDEFELFNGTEELTGESEIDPGGMSVRFYPTNLLPIKANLRAVVKGHWEQRDNGTWSAFMDNGVAREDIFEATFSTTDYITSNEIVDKTFPGNNANNVSVLPTFVVTFSHFYHEPFWFEQDSRMYRGAFGNALLFKGDSQVPITSVLSVTGDSVLINTDAILSPSTTYTLRLKTYWEVERNNGKWTPIKLNDEIAYNETDIIFTTGAGGNLDQILSDNIVHAYPIPYQYNFLKKEHAEGYLILKSGVQNELFVGTNLSARYSTPGQTDIDVPLTFEQGSLTFKHPIPASLQNETIYKLQYFAGTSELYAAHFRTSKFDTFNEKLEGFTITNSFAWGAAPGFDVLTTFLQDGAEYFDGAEIKTSRVIETNDEIYFSSGLVQFEYIPENKWFEEEILPFYNGLEARGLKINWRNNPALKTPPYGAMYIDQQNSPIWLSENQIATNESSTIMVDACVVMHSFGHVALIDYNNARNQAANHPDKETDEYLIKLNEHDLRSPFPGTYKFKMRYVLPGKNTITSEREVSTIFNP